MLVISPVHKTIIGKEKNNMETSVFEAKCNECGWKMILMNEHVVQYRAEEHMMETGHIVSIEEVR